MIEAKRLANSSISKTVRNDASFKALVSAEAIKKTRGRGGDAWIMQKEDVLHTYLSHHCPCEAKDETKGERYNNTRMNRDSKSKTREPTHIVFVRSNAPVVLNGIKKENITEDPEGRFIKTLSCEKVCSIENIENFKDEERLISEGWTCIYTVGRIGTPLLDKITAKEYLHYGDLDYVGLNEYARIKRVFEKAQLYVPLNYFQDALKYGKKIDTRQKADNLLIRTAKQDSKVKEVLDFLHTENVYLEQEGYGDE